MVMNLITVDCCSECTIWYLGLCDDMPLNCVFHRSARLPRKSPLPALTMSPAKEHQHLIH